MQPDRCLIRRHIQNEPLGLLREVRSSGTGDNKSHLAMQSQLQGKQRDIMPVKEIADHRGDLLRVAFWMIATYFCAFFGLAIGQILVYRVYRDRVVAAH